MSNTSASGGYISPAVPSPPLAGDDLDAEFQKAVRGITGLPGQFVRPRWQPNPPKQPEPNVDWCAIGVTMVMADAGPYIEHIGAGDGQDQYQRHEDIELACTFYGPNGQRNALTLRDGLGIPQNIEALNSAGLAFVDAGEIRQVPELVNQQWIKRHDMALRFRRQVKRTYGVLNVLSADPVLVSDEIGIITITTPENI